MSAPRLAFNIASYAGTNAITWIKLFNPDIALLKEQSQYKGRGVKLFAGFYDTPLGRKSGIKASANNLIYNGIIEGTQTIFEGSECYVIFFCSSLQRVEGEPFAFTINTGEMIPAKIAQAMQLAIAGADSINNNLKVTYDKTLIKVHTSTQSAYFETTQSEQNDLLAFFRRVCRCYDLELGYNAQTNSAIIISADADVLLTEASLRIFKPALAEFISQPAWESIATASFNMVLNASYITGGTLYVPASLLLNASFLASVAMVSAFTEAPKSILGGRFKIIQVTHVGDSRDLNPSAWATQILASAL